MPVNAIKISLDVPGLEVYLFPFRSVDNRLDSMMVAISKDRNILRKSIKLLNKNQFNWDKNFQSASNLIFSDNDSGDKPRID